MLDLVVRNAKIYDGTGSLPFYGSIGVLDGKIEKVGDFDDQAKTTIDATGLTVSPGFIDPHTHYDAQFCWDKLATPSSWHGVTTAVVGNCAVGVAPCRPSLESRETLSWQLSNIESISMDLLRDSVSWNWESFPEYMNSILKAGLVLNPIFLVPMTALRLYVMGEEAQERAANGEEAEKMVAVLKEAMAAGAGGFSVNKFSGHVGYQGRPNASFFAGEEELSALASVLKELGYGIIESNSSVTEDGFEETALEVAAKLSIASGRPVLLPGVIWYPNARADWLECTERQVRSWKAKGANIVPQISIRPFTHWQDLRQPIIWAQLPCFVERIINRSQEEQLQAFAEPEFRERFLSELHGDGLVFGGDHWQRIRIASVAKEEHRQYLSMTTIELGDKQGKRPVDAMLDLAVEDGGLCITAEILHSNIDEVERSIRLPGGHIGQSDGGAHIGQFCNASFGTYFIREWVKDRGKFTMEEVIHRVTGEQAEILGLPHKGLIETGKDADILVFDENEIRPEKSEMVHDLPNGEGRFIERCQGMRWIIVNGVVTFQDGIHQGPLPGRLTSVNANEAERRAEAFA